MDLYCRHASIDDIATDLKRSKKMIWPFIPASQPYKKWGRAVVLQIYIQWRYFVCWGQHTTKKNGPASFKYQRVFPLKRRTKKILRSTRSIEYQSLMKALALSKPAKPTFYGLPSSEPRQKVIEKRRISLTRKSSAKKSQMGSRAI